MPWKSRFQGTTAISAQDETSGVDRIEYNRNDLGWQKGSSVVNSNGVNRVAARTYDLAGNVSSAQVQVKVDTEKPRSKFTSPLNNTTDKLIRDSFSFVGLVEDIVSGVSTAEISLDGTNWFPLTFAPDNTWKYTK